MGPARERGARGARGKYRAREALLVTAGEKLSIVPWIAFCYVLKPATSMWNPIDEPHLQRKSERVRCWSQPAQPPFPGAPTCGRPRGDRIRSAALEHQGRMAIPYDLLAIKAPVLTACVYVRHPRACSLSPPIYLSICCRTHERPELRCYGRDEAPGVGQRGLLVDMWALPKARAVTATGRLVGACVLACVCGICGVCG